MHLYKAIKQSYIIIVFISKGGSVLVGACTTVVVDCRNPVAVPTNNLIISVVMYRITMAVDGEIGTL